MTETWELDLDWKPGLFQLLAACSPWKHGLGVYWIQFNAALSTFCRNDTAFSGSSFCVDVCKLADSMMLVSFLFIQLFASWVDSSLVITKLMIFHDLEKVVRAVNFGAVRTRRAPSLLACLQMVQQSFVYDHITRVSASLHSLSVHFRIHLKIFLLLMVRLIQLPVSHVLRPKVTPQTKRWQTLWSRPVWISYRLTEKERRPFLLSGRG